MRREIADKLIGDLNWKHLEFLGRNYTDKPLVFLGCIGFHLYQAILKESDPQLSGLEDALKQEFDSYEKCPLDYDNPDACENSRLIDAYVKKVIQECKKDINE